MALEKLAINVFISLLTAIGIFLVGEASVGVAARLGLLSAANEKYNVPLILSENPILVWETNPDHPLKPAATGRA